MLNIPVLAKILAWLKKSTDSRRSLTHDRQVRLGVESLEDRQMPSTSPLTLATAQAILAPAIAGSAVQPVPPVQQWNINVDVEGTLQLVQVHSPFAFSGTPPATATLVFLDVAGHNYYLGFSNSALLAQAEKLNGQKVVVTGIAPLFRPMFLIEWVDSQGHRIAVGAPDIDVTSLKALPTVPAPEQPGSKIVVEGTLVSSFSSSASLQVGKQLDQLTLGTEQLRQLAAQLHGKKVEVTGTLLGNWGNEQLIDVSSLRSAA